MHIFYFPFLLAGYTFFCIFIYLLKHLSQGGCCRDKTEKVSVMIGWTFLLNKGLRRVKRKNFLVILLTQPLLLVCLLCQLSQFSTANDAFLVSFLIIILRVESVDLPKFVVNVQACPRG